VIQANKAKKIDYELLLTLNNQNIRKKEVVQESEQIIGGTVESSPYSSSQSSLEFDDDF